MKNSEGYESLEAKKGRLGRERKSEPMKQRLTRKWKEKIGKTTERCSVTENPCFPLKG